MYAILTNLKMMEEDILRMKLFTQDGEFKYLIDEFADLKIMRYKVHGWDDLTLKQKEYVYHLAEAAKYGRDIIWMQNCRYNLEIRKVIENILESYRILFHNLKRHFLASLLSCFTGTQT